MVRGGAGGGGDAGCCGFGAQVGVQVGVQARTQAPAAASGGWGKAVFLTGPAKSNPSQISEISCSSPGNCVAAGSYGSGVATTVSGHLFVVNQVRGAWGKPVTLPGLARTKEPAASPAGLACFPVGGCVLVGSYKDAAGRSQAFITSQANGTWSKIIWVPGLARLDLGHSNGQDAEATSISCTGPTKCSAGGYYQPDDGATHAFVASRP